MRWRYLVGAIGLVLILLIGVAIRVGAHQAPPPIQPLAWEYLTVPTEDPTASLDQYGAAGWELVAVVQPSIVTVTPGTTPTVLYFKRPRIAAGAGR